MVNWFEKLLIRAIAILRSRRMPPRPLAIIVQNNSSVYSSYVLFGAAGNRFNDTFGNPKGILVTYGLAGYTYAMLLARTERVPICVECVRIDLLDDNKSNLSAPLSRCQVSEEGTVFHYSLTPDIVLGDGSLPVIEIKKEFVINADTTIHGSLLPNSGIRISFFPVDNNSMLNKLAIDIALFLLWGIQDFILSGKSNKRKGHVAVGI